MLAVPPSLAPTFLQMGVRGALTLVGVAQQAFVSDAVGTVAYPLVKVLGGRARDVRWSSWLVAVLLLCYFLLIRSRT